MYLFADFQSGRVSEEFCGILPKYHEKKIGTSIWIYFDEHEINEDDDELLDIDVLPCNDGS